MLPQPAPTVISAPAPASQPVPLPPPRRKMPSLRSGITVKAEHAGLKLYITVNFFDDNQQPGELFIRISKQGSFLQSAFDMLALQASYMLQHNIPISWLCGPSGKWRHIRVDPMIDGPLTREGTPTQLSIYDTLSNAVMSACSTFGANTDHGCLPDLPPAALTESINVQSPTVPPDDPLAPIPFVAPAAP